MKIIRDKRRKKPLRFRGPQYPLLLPCGCQSSAKNRNDRKDVLLLRDGRRICRCGLAWRIGWLVAGKVDRDARKKGKTNA